MKQQKRQCTFKGQQRGYYWVVDDNDYKKVVGLIIGGKQPRDRDDHLTLQEALELSNAGHLILRNPNVLLTRNVRDDDK